MTETLTIDEQLQAARAAHRERQAEAVRREITRRIELVTRCDSPEARAVAVEVCRRDPVAFFDDWLWTYDPRNADATNPLPTDLPFVLRPTQAALVRWLEERERTQTSGLVEKSRDEGMSFVVLGYMLHRWLFVPGFAGAVGSRKQDLVDKAGDPKSLFEKVRYMLYRLPRWMVEAGAEGFSRKEHDNFLRLVNPKTGASLAGEAGDEMGRGGRASLYFVDEWAFVERAQKVDAAISQNSNVRIKGSTPNGVGTRMYEERFSGRFPVFTMHWKDNPDKNYTAEIDGERVHPWDEKQRAELDDETYAQEVAIDYTASAEGIVIPAKWVRAAVEITLAARPPSVAGADLSEGGSDKTVYAHRAGPVVTRILPVASGLDWQQAAELERLAREDGAARFVYDRLGIGAGITATIARKEGLPFAVEGVGNADTPTDRVFEDQPAPPDGQKPLTNAERFANLAAEGWWGLRLRFKRAYERHVEGVPHPDEDCVAVPNDPTLVAQLSQPTYHRNSKDKIVVDKRGKGTASPDHAEAVLYAFMPEAPAPVDLSDLPRVRTSY